MRILIFHGYLLSGTGSNVYNARTAQALVALGHDVHLLCQDRHPERLPFVDAAGDWDAGALDVRELTARDGERDGAGGAPAAPRGRCTVYRPDIGDLLPVYVADTYEGIRARTFAQCSDLEIARYVDANVAAVRELSALVAPDIALASHLVMGPVILARALRDRVPYAAKIHGSALEYTVKPQPERFAGFAREGLAGAAAVLVGSRHTAQSLWEALGDERLAARTRLGPPGVDVELFAPRDRRVAQEGLHTLSVRLREAVGQVAPLAPPVGAPRLAAARRRPPAGGERVRPRRAGGGAGTAADRRRARPPRGVRRQADRQQGRRPAARGLAAGARRRGPGAPGRGRLWRL